MTNPVVAYSYVVCMIVSCSAVQAFLHTSHAWSAFNDHYSKQPFFRQPMRTGFSLNYQSWALYQSSANNDVAISDDNTTERKTLSVKLTKPLGLILEEQSGGQGVIVKDVSEAGSVSTSLSKENIQQIIGSSVLSIQGLDVSLKNFDTVMSCIINAPDMVQLEFLLQNDNVIPEYDIGTDVTIVVKQSADDVGKPITLKVGDNLRQKLLENNIEVYSGLKQKLGNCGGAGQCTFCAFDFLETDGWVGRLDYEEQKLRKFPNARLTCQNLIQGPAIILKTAR